MRSAFKDKLKINNSSDLCMEFGDTFLRHSRVGSAVLDKLKINNSSDLCMEFGDPFVRLLSVSDTSVQCVFAENLISTAFISSFFHCYEMITFVFFI